MRKAVFLKASFTIEASIILPIIMLLIATVLYCSLYFHDILKLKTSTYSFILIHFREMNSEELESELIEYMEKRLAISSIANPKLVTDDEGVELQYTYSFNTPIQVIRKMFFEDMEWVKYQRVSVNNLEKSEYLRKTKALKFWEEDNEE